jgi:hypothetical protein
MMDVNSDVPLILNDNLVDNVENCPDIVQHEINFLKESWANLADQEDAAIQATLPLPLPSVPNADGILGKPPDVNVIAEASIPCQDDNDGFKLVTSRSAKRIEKQKLTSKKKISITSSRAGSNKPSK